MRFALKNRLQLLKYVELELEKIVVVSAKKPPNAASGHISHLLVLVCQLLTDQLEDVQAIVEMRVPLEQC